MVIGSIRCISWRKHTLAYQVALLRVNRQIHYETQGIFHRENFWTLVLVNKANFGKEMKECGFPVLPISDLCRRMRCFVMGVSVKFPSVQDQTDTFLVASTHLKQLVRALWTAKGASEMVIKICIQPQRTNKSPSERCLLRQFFNLSGIKELVVLGASEHGYVNELVRAITTTDAIDHDFTKLGASLECLEQHIRAERWTDAVAQAARHSIIMQDCKLVYGNCFAGNHSHRDINISIARNKTSKEIRIATAMALAEVTLYQGQYASTLKFADRAFDLVTLVSIIHPGSYLFEMEMRCYVYLIQARAYMRMQQRHRALCYLDCARDLMPNSVAVASAFQTWQVMFGPSSSSSPSYSSSPRSPSSPPPPPPPSPSSPPPTTSTSSAFAPFPDATDDMDVDDVDVGAIYLEGWVP